MTSAGTNASLHLGLLTLSLLSVCLVGSGRPVEPVLGSFTGSQSVSQCGKGGEVGPDHLMVLPGQRSRIRFLFFASLLENPAVWFSVGFVSVSALDRSKLL